MQTATVKRLHKEYAGKTVKSVRKIGASLVIAFTNGSSLAFLSHLEITARQKKA
jgi:hypothetical protein